jgi:hypothetical protein
MAASKAYAVFFLLATAVIGASAAREMYLPWPPASQANEWTIEEDSTRVLTMSRFYPYGVVDRQLVLRLKIIDGHHRPVDGSAHYPGGGTRDLKEGELNYFWEYAGAKEAATNYLRRKNGGA